MRNKHKNLSTAQRLIEHLNKNARDFYAPIQKRTKEILERESNQKD